MNKKRLILLILAAVLAVFTMGCQFQEEAPSLEVDNVAIYFGVSSYAMFGADEETLRYLADTYRNLEVEPVSGEMDLTSMLTINLFHQNQQVGSFSVDQNGNIWKDGGTQCYRAPNGCDYGKIKQIYLNSQPS